MQVVQAGQQLGTDLLIGSSLGTFSHTSVAELGDFAEQMVFLWSFPPATADLPVYEALRADLAASGEEALQPENLKASPMRSWIGLYALLKMIRDAEMTEFTREGITDDARTRPRTSRCSTSSAARTGRPTPTTRASSSGPAPTTGRPTSGTPTPRRRRARGQLRRGVDDQLRRGAVRLAVRRPEPADRLTDGRGVATPPPAGPVRPRKALTCSRSCSS